MDAIDIARICHEANRAYQLALRENPSPHWEDAPAWMRESALQSVKFRLDNPGSGIAAQHEAWMKHRLERGWKYGPVKDEGAKTHPDLVEYNDLPEAQRLKDALMMRIVSVFAKPREFGLAEQHGAWAANPVAQFPNRAQSQAPTHADEVPFAEPPSYSAPPEAGAVREIRLVKRPSAPEIPNRPRPKKGKE